MLQTVMSRSAIIAFACALSLSAHAMADGTRRAIHIPSGELAVALEMLAKQSGTDLVYRPDQVAGFRTGGIDGELSTEEAVTQLLKGTPLTLSIDATGAMLIALPAAVPQASDSKSLWSRMRLAQSSTPAPSQGATDSGAGAPGRELPAVLAEERPGLPQSRGIPEILVQGARSLNTDIARTEDDVQPYVVFARSQIERSMTTNVEQFLKSRLPMNTAQTTASQNSSSTRGNQSSIDLRGLGASQTLILVDGRRMPAVNAAQGFLQADINGIPMSAIERIEVLPATASGIHGGGATGGVINIITRKDYSGVNVSGTFGDTLASGGANQRFDLSAGMSFFEGRTRIMLSGSYADADPLLAGERDFAKHSRELLLQNNPAAMYAGTVVGYTSNIRSVNGQNLQLKPAYGGTNLQSPNTFVPVGYTGVASDNAAALVTNAGRYNLDLPDTAAGTRQSLLNNPTVKSGSLSVRQQVGSYIEAFADAGWYENVGQTALLTAPSPVTLQPGVEANPFTTAITVSFPPVGIHSTRDSISDTRRASAGAIVRLPADWMVAADYSWSRSRFFASTTSPIVGDPDGSGPGLAVTTALGNGTLNVLRDLNLQPLDWTAYLLPSPNSLTDAETVLKGTTLRLSGPAFELPAGPIVLSGVLEYREEEAEGFFLEAMGANAARIIQYRPDRSQTVSSMYLEARTPLISSTQAIPFVRELELQTSARRDEYETRAPSPISVNLTSYDAPLPDLTFSSNEVQATKYTLGLKYRPVIDVQLRASLGTGFLPPSIHQIVPNVLMSQTLTLIDPKRGAVSRQVSVNELPGGNPDLVPEESRSWSVGAIFTPRFAEGLRISLDYTKIEKTNEIQQLLPQDYLNLEDLLPGRVTRAELTDADRAAGYTGGAITQINSRMVNIAATKLNACDLQVDYALQTGGFGNFTVYGVVTRQQTLERQTVPTAAALDIMSFSDGPLQWRGNAGVNWNQRALTIGWDAQYYDSYRVYASTDPAPAIATKTLNQGSANIGSQIYHDVFARYRFESASGWLSGTDLLFGIENVFDEEPQILAGASATGGYSTYGDPRLRRFSVTVTKRFGGRN